MATHSQQDGHITVTRGRRAIRKYAGPNVCKRTNEISLTPPNSASRSSALISSNPVSGQLGNGQRSESRVRGHLAVLIRGGRSPDASCIIPLRTRRAVLPAADAIEDCLLHFRQVTSEQISVALQSHANQLASGSNFRLAKQLLQCVLDGALRDVQA